MSDRPIDNRPQISNLPHLAPGGVPTRLAGGAEGLAVAVWDAHRSHTGRRAGFEFNQTGVLARAADDARDGQVHRLAGHGDVTELFVLVAQLRILDAAVDGGALHARREMAPVGRG